MTNSAFRPGWGALGRLTRALLAVTCAVIVAIPATPSFAALPQRSESEIRTRWEELRPTYTGDPYRVAPSWQAPYALGALTPGYQTDGLASINYMRYLAGLPDDIALDPDLVSAAQHGAVLLAAGQFAHSQPRPADMPQTFYDIGNAANGQSNIGWGYPTLWNFNVASASDSEPSNLAQLGHRRWLLNPQMRYTGMGFANGRSATYAFDSRRASAVDYESINWPAAGYFPVEMFDARTPWSVSLNPAKYRYDRGPAGHTVTLTRIRDGRVWTFNSADTNTSGEYFNFDTNGFGVPNAFVFRPDPASVGRYLPGDRFTVTISGGIYRRDGSPTTISYTTIFTTQDFGLVRIAGQDRYATAIEVSRRAFPDGARTVVLATGADYPDALTASPLAGAYHAPVLLVPTVGLTAELGSEIRRLSPEKIIIVGAVPRSVDTQCDVFSSVNSVERLTGQNRFKTADLIAEALVAKNGRASTVIVATGRNYPDAVSVAPLATAKGWPILLASPRGGLEPSTTALIDDIAPANTLLVGGTAAVPASVESKVTNPTRLAGNTRYETCGAIADYGWKWGMSMEYVALATGTNFPDALAAGPLVAARSGTLLLTDPRWLPTASSRRINAKAGDIEEFEVIGGPGVVSEAAVADVSQLLR